MGRLMFSAYKSRGGFKVGSSGSAGEAGRSPVSLLADGGCWQRLPCASISHVRAAL